MFVSIADIQWIAVRMAVLIRRLLDLWHKSHADGAR